MSSVERSMDTTLPGMVMEDFTVDKQVPVNMTLSEGTNVAIEQHAKDKKSKGKGGCIKRAWKAVKRPFCRSSHETNVQAMVPDTAIPCASSVGEEIRAQLSSVSGPCQLPTTALPPKEDRCDDLDVVSITSSDWSVCNNIQQNSELPADASAEYVENKPQEQHVKEERRNGKEEKKKEKEEKMKKKEKEKEEKKNKEQKEEEDKKKKKQKEEEEKKKKKEKEKEEKKNEEEEKRKKKAKEKEEKKKEKEKEKEEKKKEKEEKMKEEEEKKKKKEKEKEEKKNEEEEKRKKKAKEKEEKQKKKEKEKEDKKKEKEDKKKEKEDKMKNKENEKEEKKELKKKKKNKEEEEKQKVKEEKKKKKEKDKEERKKEKEEEKKRNGPFIKRAWKGVKRPFRRSNNETNVEAMVPDTAIPFASSDGEEIRAQLSSVSGQCKLPTAALPPKEDRCDDLDVVSITSSDCSVICNNIQQNSEPPADASAEDVETEPQEQHVKEEKQDHIDFSTRVENVLDDTRWKLRKLRMTRNDYRRRWQYYMYIRRCPHERCCDHTHLCCLRNDDIFLGTREQLMSTVPSVTRPFLIFPKQSRKEPFREHNPEEEDGIKKEGIFKRKWKAVKRRLFRWESRRTLLLKNMPECVFDSQESTDSEQIIYERPSLNVPPMFQPSKESFYSSYKDNYVILGVERFGQVCLATRLSDGKKVAFKEFNRYQYSTSTYIMAGYTERLMNEVAMMTLLKQPPISPYIIQMLEWFHEKYDTFIILEDPGSWTVLEKILKLHPLSEKVARVIMRQAVQAAQHCIAHGVFHYLINAENILINTNTLDIKLFDFGYSMPYMGKKYYRLGDTDEYEEKHPEWTVPGCEYSAISVNVYQLGSLLYWMVWRPHDHQMTTYFPISKECRRLIDWCRSYDMTERPTLEQILQHRWFTKE